MLVFFVEKKRERVDKEEEEKETRHMKSKAEVLMVSFFCYFRSWFAFFLLLSVLGMSLFPRHALD